MAKKMPEVEQIAEEYINIWNERKYSKIPDVVSESFVMYDPAAIENKMSRNKGEIHGPSDLKMFIQNVVTGFPDFHVDIMNILSDSDTVMYDGEITMTHMGHFYWIPPSGRGAKFRYMGMIRIVDGKVQEHRVYPPLLEISRQLEFTSLSIIPYLPRFAWGKLKQTLSI
jgi:predicted ester cyclase